jgi:hypothetical protein
MVAVAVLQQAALAGRGEVCFPQEELTQIFQGNLFSVVTTALAFRGLAVHHRFGTAAAGGLALAAAFRLVGHSLSLAVEVVEAELQEGEERLPSEVTVAQQVRLA